ncbi:glycosyltransferase [Corynebacterium lehmanniae]|uniref:CgeB family protein n=1 Tax=Corynebacterium haemomassiliense TaxID=2754726 RepID=UPI00370D9FD2
MQFPRFFQLNLGLTSVGFIAMVVSRLGQTTIARSYRSALEGVGLTLIGAGEVVKLVRLERESQRAAERARVGQRALSRLAAKANTAPRVTRAERRKSSRDTSLKDLRVAAILDEFSYRSFAPECQLTALTPESWKQQFHELSPDLFFCESAWAGHDSDLRPWRGKIYASEKFSHENRQVLLEILEHCKREGIPTVFWNKEDPSHFDDKAHNFVDTALKFDHIFTTDSDCVHRYKEEFGHPSVHTLQFAAQPKLFNPIEFAERTDDVVFAGGWYENHRQRSEDMERIFDSVVHAGRELKIYDRYFYFRDDDTHIYPARFARYIHPPVPAEDMAGVYKESTIGITINTESNSETMFARRIFELMACNTFVVSNYSKGIDMMFGDSVLYLDRSPGALTALTKAEMDESRRSNLRLVLSEHTYAKRLEKVARVAGLSFESATATVAALILLTDSRKASDAFDVLRNLDANTVKERIIAVGPSVEPFEFGLLLRDFNRDGVQVIWLGDDAQRGHELLGDVGVDQFLVSRVESFPAQEDVGEVIGDLLLHAQYSPCPVTFLKGEQKTYRIVSGNLNGPTIVPAALIHEVLGSELSGTPFDQIFVDRSN